MQWAKAAEAGSSYGFRVTDNVRQSASVAQAPVAFGKQEDIDLEVEHLKVVLASQEVRPGHAHFGNFAGSAQAGGVPDRNWACFILSSLIPMLNEHGDRLPAGLQDQLR